MDSLYSEDKPPMRKPKSVDEQEQEAPVQLMDKKMLPEGCEVGSRYQIEVTAEHGDEVEFKVVEGDKKDEPAMASSKPGMAEDDDLAQMNSKY